PTFGPRNNTSPVARGNQVIKRKGVFLLPLYRMIETVASFDPTCGPGCTDVDTVYYAGGSSRRQHFLRSALPDSNIQSVGGGEEEDIRDVRKIMSAKVSFAAEKLAESEAYIIAADTRTEIGIVDNGKESFVSKGKPKTNETVRENFAGMAAVAKEKGYGYYRVVSASGICINGTLITDQIQCGVTLYKETLELLSTPEGFASYERVFENFYNGEAYEDLNAAKITLSDLSGGISLPVLVALGAVESIDGIRFAPENAEDFQESYDALFGGLYTAAVGFSPRILSAIYPQAYDLILNWEWLQKVSMSAINARQQNGIHAH
ncbi:MAG TPA: hypothetical protein VLH19_05615, partial [Patescibacteria group bacterium]|nr:hypothetical protein [Patescibacteria group bacterium]